MGLGMSGVFIPTQTAAFATIWNEDMGGASMLFNALRQLGGAVGVAVLATMLAAVGPVSHAGGRLVSDLTSYRAAPMSAAAAALIGARIRDEDAASTITRWRRGQDSEASSIGQGGGELPEPPDQFQSSEGDTDPADKAILVVSAFHDSTSLGFPRLSGWGYRRLRAGPRRAAERDDGV